MVNSPATSLKIRTVKPWDKPEANSRIIVMRLTSKKLDQNKQRS